MADKDSSGVSAAAPVSPYSVNLSQKISDYVLFLKLRLSFLVVFSAVIGYVLIAGGQTDWIEVMWLTLAGFLVTGAANGFNQIIEKDYDAIMDRTKHRPIPGGRMTVQEASAAAFITGFAGLVLLWIFLNPLSSLLSLLSTILYSLAYTPLKRVTPFAVLVGAFPGAFPPLLGAIAATDGFGSVPYFGLVLFAIQFIWQFPHFWGIAWVMDEDYKKAGFRLLPSGQRDKSSAFQILIYTLFLLLISMVPVYFGMTRTVIAPIVILLSGLMFFYQAVRLYRSCSVEDARKVMFGSFIYLPIVQLAILLG